MSNCEEVILLRKWVLVLKFFKEGAENNMAQFHSRTGTLVTLSNGNKSAQRNMPQQEFNNGVVLSAEPLHDNQLFEVRIDKKLNSWSGSIEIGVTTSDPSGVSFPTSATGFRDGTWVMSGSSILKDGHSTNEDYGRDLDQLVEGDRVGVMRTSNGALHFFVNGIDQGPADTRVPSRLFAVVDMYGKCAQVTLVGDSNRDKVISNEITNEAIAEATYLHSNERLLFHEHCGTLVKLTNNRRAAERKKPIDEFNNGVVMTNRPINDDEMFEIRLDRLVQKWSGSIEVGVTTHNPSTLSFPATMTNMRSGTIMMSGSGILINGKGTQREYGDYNLDELAEGDRIGLMRLSNGSLHYYINGVDQGIAEVRAPQLIWGVVDLYGMAVKVTILDRSDPCYVEHEARARRTNHARIHTASDTMDTEDLDMEVEKLLFHPHCGHHATVINGQRTAHRPNAVDEFNHGVVLTNRPLRPGELFEVCLDRRVDKWAGSVDLGVTTHSPHAIDFPSTMTNIRSGTWIMTGNGVMHNGTTVQDEYGLNLDQLKVGDRVGAMRLDNGDLHFFVNGIDQGLAATNVPENIYGIIDLYGQACQASIVYNTEASMSDREFSLPKEESSHSIATDELRFDSHHGKNAEIIHGGKAALRPNSHSEFNDAIVITNRPLRDNELFEITIDHMIKRWSGSIEAGVTLIPPHELDFPTTMTDIDYDTWMLSGSAIMQDGNTIRNGYDLDLDNLTTGSRIGMMRRSDGTLHFFYDGTDMGVAYTDIPSGIYAVIDLYGQCAQVTITNGRPLRQSSPENILNLSETEIPPCTPLSVGMTHRFSQCCAQNIAIENNGCTATRTRHFNYGVVFSADPLKSNELFEVKIEKFSSQWSNSLHIGLTALVVCDSMSHAIVPKTALDITSKPTWVVAGSCVKYNGKVIKENYAPSLDRLQVGSHIGVKRLADGTMHLYINGEDMGVAASNVPRNVFAVVDLFGQVCSVSTVSTVCTENSPAANSTSNSMTNQITASSAATANTTTNEITTLSNDLQQQCNVTNSILAGQVDLDQDVVDVCLSEFHTNHSKNIELLSSYTTARRTSSYNQAVVMSHQPLQRNNMFKIRIDELNPHWTSSLSIGVTGFSPSRFTMPVAGINIKKPCWIIQGNSVFHSGVKILDNYGPNLNSCVFGDTLSVCIENDNTLHLYVNGVDQGVAARELPKFCYAIVDVYGQCQQISIINDEQLSPQNTEYREKADLEDSSKEKKSEGGVIRNCEYQNLCTRVKHALALPDGYFTSSLNRCFCETCHRTRSDESYYKKGEPPKDYAVPLGWCRFALRLSNKSESQHVTEKWHVAYYGTHSPAVRKILDSGDLLRAVESGSGYSLTPETLFNEEKNKPEEIPDIKQIVLSPTIRYSGNMAFAPRYEFQDPKTCKLHYARVVLQTYIRPGSYKISSQTLGINEQIDPHFSNTELEWATKERGAIVLAALLLKVE